MECCCTSIPNPDTNPCPVTLDVPAIIAELDRLLNAGCLNDASQYLASFREKAHECGDWRAELSMMSEQLGLCRRTNDAALAEECVSSVQQILTEHRMNDTVSGATVLLNAATTLKCFGEAERSMPIFRHVARVYSANLDPADYRIAGLYNNMALSYADLGAYEEAERHFELALLTVSKTTNPGNDLAVTYCNMAEMYYAQNSEDARIEQCLDRAYENLCAEGLPHDGYHAFTLSKCIPCFDKHGFFLYAKELRERMDGINRRLKKL